MRERRIATGLFFMTGLLIATYFGGQVLLLFLVLWGTLLTISFIYFQLLPPSLPCTLELPATCAKGQKITGYLHVVQDGKLPIFHGVARVHFKSLYYKQEQVISMNITLMGEEEGTAAFDIEVPYLGLMEITLEEAEIYDLLGICKKTIISSMKKYLMVMPNTREIRTALPDLGSIDPDGDEMRESVYGYDPGIYQGIRNYRYGDSMKHIHWKLTSKTGEILVKELGIPSGKEPRLYLETKLPDLEPSRIDQLIEDYFSFSMALVDQGRPHVLCWKDGGVTAQEYRVENLAMLEELMEPLFHITFCESGEEAYRDTWIYYMSPNETNVYGFYHSVDYDYLAPVVLEERLWYEG